MIEVFYCMPSAFSRNSYATGSMRFENATEFAKWLGDSALLSGPVLITGIIYL
jgi:hypothetical protein